MDVHSEKIKKIILLIVFVLALFLIPFHFTSTPNVWTDEGVFIETARNLAVHNTLALQTSPAEFFSMRNFLLSTSYPVIFPVALSLKVFGIGFWQARLPMILYMFILVLLSYLFSIKLYGKKYGFYPAILSVLLILSFSPFYGNGRPVQGEVPGLVFMILGALFLLYFEESHFQSKKWALLSALAFGLSASTKPIFLVLLSVSLFMTFIFWIKKIENRKILWTFLWGFILPIILWAYIHISSIDLFKDFIRESFHLAGNHSASSVPLIQTIFTNFFRFFTESTPILFAILFFVILSSFIFRFVKKGKEDFSISESIILLFIILNSISYLFGTGWYRYFFPANILVYLLFPSALLFLSAVLSEIFRNELLKKTLCVLPIFLIIFQFYHLVFLSNNSLVVEKARTGELTRALSRVNPSQTIFFYNSTETIIFLKGNNYSQYLSMGNFLEAGDRNALNNLIKPNYDFILTDTAPNGNVSLSCYKQEPVSRYYLLERIRGCK